MNFRRIRRTRDGVLNSDGHAVGLDLGATAVRATVLEPRMLGGRPSSTIVDVGKVDLPPGVVVNGVVQEPGPLTAALT
jgi:type IV pilus assembly protein PilM